MHWRQLEPERSGGAKQQMLNISAVTLKPRKTAQPVVRAAFGYYEYSNEGRQEKEDNRMNVSEPFGPSGCNWWNTKIRVIGTDATVSGGLQVQVDFEPPSAIETQNYYCDCQQPPVLADKREMLFR